MKSFSGHKLKNVFIERFHAAMNIKDIHGLIWLDILAEFLDNEELKEQLPKEVIEKLQPHYDHPAFWDEE